MQAELDTDSMKKSVKSRNIIEMRHNLPLLGLPIDGRHLSGGRV
jgi:hypothetical protein